MAVYKIVQNPEALSLDSVWEIHNAGGTPVSAHQTRSEARNVAKLWGLAGTFNGTVISVAMLAHRYEGLTPSSVASGWVILPDAPAEPISAPVLDTFYAELEAWGAQIDANAAARAAREAEEDAKGRAFAIELERELRASGAIPSDEPPAFDSAPATLPTGAVVHAAPQGWGSVEGGVVVDAPEPLRAPYPGQSRTTPGYAQYVETGTRPAPSPRPLGRRTSLGLALRVTGLDSLLPA